MLDIFHKDDNRNKSNKKKSLLDKIKGMKKKKTLSDKIKAIKKKADKKAMKYSKKIANVKVKNKKRYYRQLVLAPKLLDLVINVLFFGVVFVLFYFKAKNPNFLDGIFTGEDY